MVENTVAKAEKLSFSNCKAASTVFATTCSSGGSATNAFGNLQGSSSSAQLSSAGLGARDDSL